MTITTRLNDFEVRVTFTGDTASPFDPKNFNSHVVAVKNLLSKTNAIVTVWRPRVQDQSEALLVFYQILQGCMLGAVTPEAFCKMMGVPIGHPRAKQYFLHFREMVAKMCHVIVNRDELLKTLHMCERKLGIKPKKHGVSRD